MEKLKKIGFCLLLCVFINFCHAQPKPIVTKLVTQFDSIYYGNHYDAAHKNVALKNVWYKYSTSDNVIDYQQLSKGVDALTAMFRVTGDVKYADEVVTIINNIITKARPLSQIPNGRLVFHDAYQYKTWIVRDSSSGDKSINNAEAILSEAYIFEYVCELLYIIHTDQRLSSLDRYRTFYNSTLPFVEKNVWEKWYNRGFRLGTIPMLAGRTHMAAHWAYMACILDRLSNDNQKKRQYQDAYNTYDNLLRQNMRPLPGSSGIYIWNSTWDAGLSINKTSEPQDVSHGNHVVSYIVEAHDLNLYWTDNDIDNLCKLLKDFLWIPAEHTFRDNIDGSTALQSSSRGTFQSDGWVKLGRYSRSVQNMYYDYMNSKKNPYEFDGQFIANLALSEVILTRKGL